MEISTTLPISLRRLCRPLLAVVLSALLYGCTHVAQITAERVEATRVVVASGLAHPWDMAFLSAREALVTEKQGGIKRVDLLDGSQRTIRGLPADLDNLRRDDPRDNSGVFGIVLHPQYADNGWIYIAYSALDPSSDVVATATKVIRARLSGDTLIDRETLLVGEPYSGDRFHYGGGLVFGRDGKLYITLGERFFNEADQPALPVAQDSADPRGAIHRINADGSPPADNPDWGEGAPPSLYAQGIRAAQGLALHPDSGEIWFSEHGSRQGDEINVLSAGANYGWPIVTSGSYRNRDYQPPQLPGVAFTPPLWSWDETVAPAGLAFYTGSEFAAWRGSLFVAGLSRGSLWRLQLQGRRVVSAEKLFDDEPVRLRQVKQGPDGRLYLLTDESDGRILRLVKK